MHIYGIGSNGYRVLQQYIFEGLHELMIILSHSLLFSCFVLFFLVLKEEAMATGSYSTIFSKDCMN